MAVSHIARLLRADDPPTAGLSSLLFAGLERLRRHWPLAAVYAAVVSLAIGVLAYGTATAWAAAPVPPLTILLFWVLFLVITEAGPVALPRGGFMTVSSAFDYAAIVLFGPVAAAWIDVVSGALVHGLVRPRPPARVLYNLSTYVLATLAGGAVFRALGGSSGGLSLAPRELVAFAGLGLTYFAVNTGLVSLILAARTASHPWRIWQVNYYWTVPHLLTFLPIGALVALVHGAWGVPALVLFLLPLLLVRHAFKLYLEMREDLVDFSTALVGVIEEVDPYTRRHSIRVATYAERLARGLGRSEEEVRKVRLAGLLHDLGKVGQERSILLKPARLDAAERRSIQAHPAAGAEIVSRIRALTDVATVVRHHHERPDGEGYPARLVGRSIPLGSRVVLVADAFDAMTSDRPYRPGMSTDRAVAELLRNAGTQFDSRVVDTLVRMRERGEFEIIDDEVGDRDIRHVS
jgi:putative nucleotidyltransferase with HDIG domain